MKDIEKIGFSVTKAHTKKRLDVFLKEKLINLSRMYIQKLIKDGNITVNDLKTTAGYKLKFNDILKVELIEKNILKNIEAEAIDIDVIYEDKDIIVVNKPAGMVVHPACGNFTGTLVNALLYYFKDLKVDENQDDSNMSFRPGLVHRLDKNTSGIMVVARNKIALDSLMRQFSKRTIEKTYFAICYGVPETLEGLIDAPICRDKINRKKMTIELTDNSKEAITHFKIKKQLRKNLVMLEVKPKTGRTHQIRVHLKYIKLPILGDSDYGVLPFEFKDTVKRSLLHAYSLKFIHPRSKKHVKFFADLPKDFKEILEYCKK